VLLAAAILTALGSLGIAIGSFVQAWWAYIQMNNDPPKNLISGFAYAMLLTMSFFWGWLFILAGGVLALAGAIVAIIAAAR
jgi:hypothetical protein